MTDQLDDDLRALLARRANEVMADVAAGEQAIAQRLTAGDADLAEVVAIAPRRRRRLLVAAAVVAVVAIGAAVALTNDDSTVDAGPLDTTPASPAAVLEFRPVEASGPSATLGASAVRSANGGTICYQLGDPLPGNPLIDSVGVSVSFSGTGTPIGGCEDSECPSVASTTTAPDIEVYGVHLTLTPDGIEQFNALAAQCYEKVAICPTGQLAIVVDDVVLSAPTIQQPSYERDAIEISGTFTEAEAKALAAALRSGTVPAASTTTTHAAGQTNADPTVGDQYDSAKDVAERVALQVFGTEYVTMAATDDGDITHVTMEGEGGTVVAEVTYDAGLQRQRLSWITSPELDDGGSFGELNPSGQLVLQLPAAGRLVLAALGNDLLQTRSVTTEVPAPGPFTLDGGDQYVDVPWVLLTLETQDGRVLRALGRP